MEDTNVGIRTEDGTLLEVIYPMRIGIEYETPQLDRDGARMWNIDPFRALHDHRFGRLVVGKWGTAYGDSQGVVKVIPCNSVITIETLPEDKVNEGRENRRKEAQKCKDDWNERNLQEQLAKTNSSRFVTLKEYRDLEERVARLEVRS